MFQNKYIYSVIFIFLFIISYLFKLDLSGGSAVDLETHWNFIQKLKNIGLFNIFELTLGDKSVDGLDSKLLNFPLHHIIFSQIYLINSNKIFFQNFYFILSFLIPFLFYLCCKERFTKIYKGNLILFCSLIFALPNFQSASIWGNNQNTALIFFLISIYFFIKLENSSKYISSYLFCSFLFLFLASYTKQYFVVFFPIIFIKSFFKFRFTIFPATLLSSIFAFPGLYYLHENPALYNNLIFSATDFRSSIFVVLSILCFYLIPFFLLQLRSKEITFDHIFINRLYLTCILIFFLFAYFFSKSFFYHSEIGGGIFIKLNNLLFNDYKYFIFLSCFLSMILFYYSTKKIDDLILTLILLISFSSGWFIFQKYFEPMYIIVFVLMYKKELIQSLLNRKLDYVYLYFLFYWLCYFLYRYHKIYIT